MKASDTVIYTLTCSSCGNSYYSKEAFPKHQHCKTCTLAFKAGIKEVVEWINENFRRPFSAEEWQSKLKEWEVE